MKEYKKTSQKRLRECLEYNPKNGLFVWKKRKNFRPSIQARDTGRIAGTLHPNGYVYIILDGVKYLAHRLAWLYMIGKFPDMDLDHIDTNKSNNKFNNLREATESQNRFNSPLNKNNTSGYRGVTHDKKYNKWISRIIINKKMINLGRYNSKEEAYSAYCKRARDHAGKFARV